MSTQPPESSPIIVLRGKKNSQREFVQGAVAGASRTARPASTTKGAIRVPPGYFGMPLGLAGLAAMWQFAAHRFGAPAAVGSVIALIAGAVWVVLTASYLAQGFERIGADFRDTALSPFLATPVMSALILGTILDERAPAAGRALVIALLIIGVLLIGALIGHWMNGGLDESLYGPAYYLPGGGLGFVGSEAASAVGLPKAATAYFAIGVFTWVFTSAIIFRRLNFLSALPRSLFPTVTIELGPPAVAGTAYFLMGHGSDSLSLGIATYLVIMVMAQLWLLPLYLRLSFTPGFWAFTFPSIATATLALRWLALEHPTGQLAYAWIAILLATCLTGAIAARSIWAVAARQLSLRRHIAIDEPDGGSPAATIGGA
jgi:tellurite resistance protein